METGATEGLFRVMNVSEINLQKLLDFRPAEGRLLLGRDRMLLFRQDAFAKLRRIIYDQLGDRVSRGLLSQFGYTCGKGDYEIIRSTYSWDTEQDEIASGPVMHMWEGIAHVEVTKLEYDRRAGQFAMTGIWRNSYEAEISLKEFGLSNQPCCYTLTGYASGWGSAFFGRDLIAIERQCIGKGDPFCTFELRKPDEWGEEADLWMESLRSSLQSVTREQGAIIERQRAELRELAVPVIQIWDGILTLSVVGGLDNDRAAAITEGLLARIVEARARFAILDITALEHVDAATASYFMRIVTAARLLGAECVISGIRPAVAQSLIAAGAGLSRVTTLASLQDALRYCLDHLGVRLSHTRK